MPKSTFLLLLALLPCLSFAQRQYLDAIVTMNDGSKINGKIAVENWLRSPRSLDFKTGDGASKTYQITDLTGFEVTRNDGGRLVFDRREVELEVSPYLLNELDQEPTLHYQRDTVWLQLIYQGTWKLYAHTDRVGKTHYLLETEGQQPVELVRKPWRRQNNHEFNIQHVELYRKQLSDLAQACPAAQKKLLSKGWGPQPGEGLREKDLVVFCKLIDECKGQQAAYMLIVEKAKFTGHILAGAHLSTYRFSPFTKREIKGITGFQIGFGVNLPISKSNKRLALYNEAFFYNDNSVTDTSIIIGTQNFYSILTYSSTQIGLNNMLSIRISKLPIAPTFKVGLAHRFGINWDITSRAGLSTQLETAPTFNRNFYKNFYEFGPTIGASFQYRRIGLDIRYSWTYDISGFLGSKPRSSFLGLNLTYQVF